MASIQRQSQNTLNIGLPNKMSKVRVVQKCRLPDQFILTSRCEISSEEASDEEIETNLLSPYCNRTTIGQLRRGDEMGATETPDLDYMMPEQVREVLQSEGFTRPVIDRTIGTAERRHRKAKYLQVQQQKKKIAKNKTNLQEKQKQNEENEKNDKIYRQEKRDHRPRPWQKVPKELSPSDPKEDKMTRDLHKYQNEIQRTKWLSEQQLEKISVNSDFIFPRILLISSKVPKCHLLSNVILPDVNILSIVYDFDQWSFEDILDVVHAKLEEYREGCKATSILLLCQGGPGYLYLLPKFVVTPQKLQKDAYKCAKEFWKKLGSYVSKVNPEQAELLIAGCNLCGNKQGIQLVSFLRKLLSPNIIDVSVPDEDTDLGQSKLGNYFNYRRYKLWTSHHLDSQSEIDFETDDDDGSVKSWTELAAGVSDDDYSSFCD